MNRFQVALASLLVLLSGCTVVENGSLRTDRPREKVSPESKVEHQARMPARLTKRQKEIVSEFIGLTESEARNLAEQQGRRFRVSWRDDEGMSLTAEFAPGRISAAIEEGVVIYCNIEGTEPHKIP